MKKNSTYQGVFCMSHKSSRIVKRFTVAEMLDNTKGIYEGSNWSIAYSKLFSIDLEMHLFLASRILFTSISTLRKSFIEKSTNGDFEFQAWAFENISLIHVITNLEDPLENKDSSLTDALHLTLFNDRLFVHWWYVWDKNPEKNFD